MAGVKRKCCNPLSKKHTSKSYSTLRTVSETYIRKAKIRNITLTKEQSICCACRKALDTLQGTLQEENDNASTLQNTVQEESGNADTLQSTVQEESDNTDDNTFNPTGEINQEIVNGNLQCNTKFTR